MKGLSTYGSVLSTLGFCMVAFPSTLLASKNDPWLGRDKALHFSFSAVLALSGYGACRLLELKIPAWLCGGTLAVSAGLTKEGLDLLGYGHPSWRDLAWDGIGTATGLGLALGVEALWRYQADTTASFPNFNLDMRPVAKQMRPFDWLGDGLKGSPSCQMGAPK